MRKYKSGSKFCLWRWTETDSGYLTRLHLIMTPFFAICIHWLNTPDPEPYQHDHPVSFLSIILRGWYTEWRNEDVYKRRWFNFMRASSTDRHTIIKMAPKTVTLCFMSGKKREWGFHKYIGHDNNSDPWHQWIWWKDYYAKKRQGVQP